MSLALLTRGYICPPPGELSDIELGPGPDIVDADNLTPVIVRAKVEPDPEPEP